MKIIFNNGFTLSISYKGLVNRILKKIGEIGEWAASKLEVRLV